MTSCARPACVEPMAGYLLLHRTDLIAELLPLHDPVGVRYGVPLCAAHLRRVKPPEGWELVDRIAAAPATPESSPDGPATPKSSRDLPATPESSPDGPATPESSRDLPAAAVPAPPSATLARPRVHGAPGSPTNLGPPVWLPQRGADGDEVSDLRTASSPLLRRAFRGEMTDAGEIDGQLRLIV